MKPDRSMLQTTRAIVLRTIEHGDHTLVLRAHTTRWGLRSYLVRTGKRSGASSAALQPLSRVEIVAEEHSERELQRLREIRVERPFLEVGRDPVRGAVALFVQEVLYKVLRAEAPEPALDEFLHEALEALDTAPDLRHFPLVFLMRLSAHLGFHPEPPGSDEQYFDLREGYFIPGHVPHGHAMGPPLSHALSDLIGVELHDLPRLSLPPGTRRGLLDHLLLYYRIHLEGLGELRSPTILHQILA